MLRGIEARLRRLETVQAAVPRMRRPKGETDAKVRKALADPPSRDLALAALLTVASPLSLDQRRAAIHAAYRADS